MEKGIYFGIDVIARKLKADRGSACIFARITVNGERVEISIKERIKFTDWNSSREIVNGKSIEARAINYAIENIRFRIREKYRPNFWIDVLQGSKKLFVEIEVTILNTTDRV